LKNNISTELNNLTISVWESLDKPSAIKTVDKQISKLKNKAFRTNSSLVRAYILQKIEKLENNKHKINNSSDETKYIKTHNQIWSIEVVAEKKEWSLEEIEKNLKNLIYKRSDIPFFERRSKNKEIKIMAEKIYKFQIEDDIDINLQVLEEFLKISDVTDGRVNMEIFFKSRIKYLSHNEKEKLNLPIVTIKNEKSLLKILEKWKDYINQNRIIYEWDADFTLNNNIKIDGIYFPDTKRVLITKKYIPEISWENFPNLKYIKLNGNCQIGSIHNLDKLVSVEADTDSFIYINSLRNLPRLQKIESRWILKLEEISNAENLEIIDEISFLDIEPHFENIPKISTLCIERANDEKLKNLNINWENIKFLHITNSKIKELPWPMENLEKLEINASSVWMYNLSGSNLSFLLINSRQTNSLPQSIAKTRYYNYYTKFWLSKEKLIDVINALVPFSYSTTDSDYLKLRDIVWNDYSYGNDKNLINFDYWNIWQYYVLKEFLSLFRVKEERFFSHINFEQWTKDSENMSFMEVMQAISKVENTISPYIAINMLHHLDIGKKISEIDFLVENQKIQINNQTVKEYTTLIKFIIKTLEDNSKDQQKTVAKNISDNLKKHWIKRARPDLNLELLLELLLESTVLQKDKSEVINRDFYIAYNQLNFLSEQIEPNCEIKLQTDLLLQNINYENLLVWNEESLNIEIVEKIRLNANETWNKNSGDIIVKQIWKIFFVNNPIWYNNINLYLEFAKNWIEVNDIDDDIKWIYQIFGRFALNTVSNFLSENMQNNTIEFEKNLSKQKINKDSLMTTLNKYWYIIEPKESNISKWLSRITSNPSYVVRKTIDKISSDDEVETKFSLELKTIETWERNWVEVLDIYNMWKNKAKLIKCNQKNVKSSLLLNRDWVVNMQNIENQREMWKLIFSAPVAFTTGNHKLTSLSISKWMEYNSFMKVWKEDWFVLSKIDWTTRILNKNNIKISDLIYFKWKNEVEVNWKIYEDRNINILDDINDYFLFFDILKQEQHSLVANMLLMENWVPEKWKKLNDWDDSRRFLIEFEDGDIWIIDSVEDMSTQELVNIANSLNWRYSVKNIVYMDTGMYDKASYYEPSWNKQIRWHNDTDESTNRIILEIR